MVSSAQGSRWRLRTLVVGLAAAALLMGAATAAQAHDILVGTSPTDGSIAKVVPDHVVLSFSEPAVAVGTEIIVTGPAGQVQAGPAVLVNNTVTKRLKPGSPAGQYTVIWQVTSTDGHPVSGRFSFSATTPSQGQRATSATATSSPTSTTATSSPTSTIATSFPTSTPASVSVQSPGVWWVVTGAAVVALLLAVFIRTRKPRSTPHDERDHNS